MALCHLFYETMVFTDVFIRTEIGWDDAPSRVILKRFVYPGLESWHKKSTK